MRKESLIHKILRKLGFIKDIEDDREMKMEMRKRAKSGASSGLDIVRMIIAVIITGKQSIQKNICTWNFGFKEVVDEYE